MKARLSSLTNDYIQMSNETFNINTVGKTASCSFSIRKYQLFWIKISIIIE